MIYLVRHGEAAAGWGSHPDPGLSELGQKQAQAVAKSLAKKGARVALTSPMQRCRETAAPFEQIHAISARVTPQVSEIHTPEDVDDRVSWLRQLMAGTWDVEGIEYQNWRQGMIDVLLPLPDQTVVFTHFVAINAIVSQLSNDSRVTVFRPGHCSVTVLSRQGDRLEVDELGSESATRVL